MVQSLRKSRIEEFEIDENGDRWLVLKKPNGTVFSRSRADTEKALQVIAQAHAQASGRIAEARNRATPLLAIEPEQATLADVTALMQEILRRLPPR